MSLGPGMAVRHERGGCRLSGIALALGSGTAGRRGAGDGARRWPGDAFRCLDGWQGGRSALRWTAARGGCSAPEWAAAGGAAICRSVWPADGLHGGSVDVSEGDGTATR